MSTQGSFPPPPPQPTPPAPKGQSATPYPQQSYPQATAQQSYQGNQQPKKTASINSAKLESAGFFKALFDFNFHNFVTIKYAKFIYIINILLIALTVIGLAIIFFGFMAYEGETGTGFFMALLILIGGAVVGLLNIIGIRLVLEFFVALTRVAENTSYLRQQAQSTHDLLSQKK